MNTKIKLAFRLIKARMPWNQYKLRKKGFKFVLNYSDEGETKLTIWPCEEDKEDVVTVADRHYEYAFTIEKFREYDIRNKDVLDVGSSGSVLPPILAALGNHVVCAYVREWPMMWPNLEFVRGDLLESDHSFGCFDVITCISTIEHFGLGRYGDKENVDGDIEGMTLLKRYLKPNGLMILTVPFGRPAIAFPAHRIYNRSRFSRLFQDLRYSIGNSLVQLIVLLSIVFVTRKRHVQ
jgi:hypothetical protein